VKSFARTLAFLVAASILLLLVVDLLLLPPAPTRLDPGPWSALGARTIVGAYHIHTTRSDGAADKAAIAHAARGAGLQFVILTDHGDGTRQPDAPEYVEGVLCLDAVEISTDQGHYVALDMPRAPYPLGGAAADVVEDVARLGGFGIAAHPDSPKASLQWTDTEAAIDGIEWLNADSEWRGESRPRLWRAGAAYLFRPGPALGTLLDRPTTLDRWDGLTRTRPVVALAGLDAHGGIGRRAEDGSRANVPGVPSYPASFHTFSLRIPLEHPWSGDAARDARALYEAIRRGRVYTTIETIATNGLLDFHALTAGGHDVPMGAELSAGTDVTLVARALKPAGAQIVLVHEGRDVESSVGGELRQSVTQPQGAYRIEVRVPHGPGDPPVPWIVSNPIYFLSVRQLRESTPLVGRGIPVEPGQWRIEKDSGSTANLRVGSGEVALGYRLRSGPRNSQYVAVAAEVPSEAFSGVRVSLVADKPMRVSVQLRTPEGARWGRSVYVNPESRTLSLAADTFRPIAEDAAGPGRLDSGRINALLLVIDLTNAPPGSSGLLRILSSELVH
jgi:hypothetical protein